MSYTPLFDSLTKGTLCGRWPDIGLWPIVLSLADRHGVVDAHPAFISGITGLPVDDVAACMKRFCEPDPLSRSEACAGARLVLLDTHRDWGWRVVNHASYRERARLLSQNATQVADGRNAKKVKRYKERHRRTPAGHPETPTNTLSDLDLNSDKNKKAVTPPLVDGLDPEAWQRWETYRRSIEKPIKPQSMEAAQRKLVGFGTTQMAVVENSIAEGYTGLFPAKTSGNGHLRHDPYRGAM